MGPVLFALRISSLRMISKILYGADIAGVCLVQQITRGIPRFRIPVVLNMSSSVSAHGVELSLQQLQAPRLASNFFACNFSSCIDHHVTFS